MTPYLTPVCERLRMSDQMELWQISDNCMWDKNPVGIGRAVRELHFGL